MDSRSKWTSVAAVILGSGILIGLEIYEEPDMSLGDILMELIQPTLIIVIAVSVVRLTGEVKRNHWEQQLLIRDLESTREAGVQWRSRMHDLLQGLSQGIGDQFEQWGLTSAESEVGLLILKGLSYKEIALLRDVSEKTVRQQAHAIFQKGKLNGRAALSAFFLEDLLLPMKPQESEVRQPSTSGPVV